MNGIFSSLKKIVQKSLKEAKDDGELQETAGEVFGNLVEGVEDPVIDSATKKLVDKVEDSFENVAEENPIDISSIMSFDSADAEEIDEALNRSAELTEALNQLKEASTVINEVAAESELKLAGATEVDNVATAENNVAKGTNTVENIADATSEGALTGQRTVESGATTFNTTQTELNTLAKIKNWIITNKLALGLVALTAVIAGVAYAIYRYNHRLDNAIKKDEKLLKQQKERLETTQKEIETTNEQIKSLEDLVEQYENAVEGSQEYYDIANKIAELQPSLVIGRDENGNAILTDTEHIYDQIEALKELNREQLQQKRFEAVDVINTSAKTINDYRTKKEQLEADLENIKNLLETERANLQKIEDDLGDAKNSSEEYILARDNVNYYQKSYNAILEELKGTSQGLRDAKQEWTSNLSYLFDDIPSTLSDEEQKYEKAVRQFAIDIANSSEEAMDSIDFLALYNNLKSDRNKNILSSLFDIDPNLSRQQYKEEAEKVYTQLIQSLVDSGFDIDEKDQLTLRVALKIDDASEKDYNNRKNRFAQALGTSGVKSRQAQSWYDQLSPEDIKIVEKNIDDLAKSVDGVSAENFVSSLDEALKLIKEAEKETEKLSDFTPQDLSEKVTSKLTSIASLYETFYSDILNGNKTRLDIDDVEGLRDALVGTGEQAGVTSEQFEEFERIVSDGTHSAQEMQDAFDTLSTQFVNESLAMNGYTNQNKALIKAQLEEAGYTRESVDAYVEYRAALYQVEEAVKNNQIAISGNVATMIAEAEAAGIDKSALIEYYTTKLTADMLSMSTVEDVIQLANELEALGINCDKLREYIALKQTAGSIEATTGFNGTTKNTAAMIAQQKGQANVNPNGVVQDLQKQLLDNINLVNKTTKEAAGGGGKEAGDAYVEEFEKALQELEDLRDAGVISEKEYLDRLKALYIKYFANRKEYLKEFKKYEKQYLEGMKSLYERAISGAITLLSDQKESIEKEKDKAIKALEEERDAQKKVIQERIDSLTEEREAMQKANEQRERALNLQKAQYELERANRQRNRLIYKNGQMQYVQDYEEVRKAKENVESTLFDMKIGKLDDEIDDLNKQLDEIDKKYDKLIEDTERFYDEQIESIQEMIDMWEELQHQAELIEVYEALNALGISAEDILSGNLDVFSQVREGYIGTLAGLSSDTEAVASAFQTTTDNVLALKEALLGYDAETSAFSQMKDDLEGVASAAGNASSAIGGGGGVASDTSTTSASSGGNAGGDTTGGTSGQTSGGNSLISSIDEVTAKEADLQKIKEAFDGENGIKGAIENTALAIGDEDDDQSLIGKFNVLNQKSEEHIQPVVDKFGALLLMINDCIERTGKLAEKFAALKDSSNGVGGSDNFRGTAYANGNWSAKSKNTNGIALTGELGTELVVDSKTGRWHTVGDNGAEFAKIKPNDIVFNHKQTESLLKNGKINSRGKAFASGTNNKFTALSSEELSKYNKLDFTKDLTEKLDFGNQKLMNIDKMVSTISSNKTINNNPVINVNNPTFTCTGVTGDEVMHQIEQSFVGLFTNAYQQSMKK